MIIFFFLVQNCSILLIFQLLQVYCFVFLEWKCDLNDIGLLVRKSCLGTIVYFSFQFDFYEFTKIFSRYKKKLKKFTWIFNERNRIWDESAVKQSIGKRWMLKVKSGKKIGNRMEIIF